jgi:phosphate starvation-inducible PhoH-like protein
MKKTVNSNEINYTPKTFNQKKYVEYLNSNNNNLLIVDGPAGSGKTLFGCLKAIDSLKKKDVNKIILTRPVVSVEEDIGFLPGNIVTKMDPWTKPIFDIFLEYYSQNDINNMINKGIIEISPLAYMRGRTFKHSFIIADEMQNSSPNQMKMLTTRIGINSRMVITGDINQSDKYSTNGLKDFIEKYNNYIKYNNEEKLNNINFIHLNNSDILRSAIVEKVIKIYEFKEIISERSYNKYYSRNISNKANDTNDAAMIPIGHYHPGY